MFAVAGVPSFAGNPLSWSLFFARQPEPDLEFTEEELEQTTNVRSTGPVKPPKNSGGRPLLWLLILLLVGGGAYVAMEPEIVTDLLGPLVGESPMPPEQPPVAMKPPRPAPPTAPVSPTEAPTPVPPPPPDSLPQGPASTAVPTPAPSMPAGSAPTPGPSPTPAMATPTPAFGEGQKVTPMVPAATAAGDMITLMQDPAGTRPGPTVRPGTTLTILDGDLQSSGWVYSVRSDEGAKGWIAENRLRLKP